MATHKEMYEKASAANAAKKQLMFETLKDPGSDKAKELRWQANVLQPRIIEKFGRKVIQY